MQPTDIKISAFAKEFNFEDVRPYYGKEAAGVMPLLVEDPTFFKLVQYLWPGMTMDEVRANAAKVNSPTDFQLLFMHKAIRTIIERSSTNLTFSGFENLDKNESYLFIANHRDILLDSAILQVLLVENGFDTSEITFGNNLSEKGFISEFGKLNRMLILHREGTSKELYEISRKISAYIRHTILDKKTSLWIAQRNGRTKAGFDSTQTGVLKMLNMSGYQNFKENFKQLKIVPVTVSYEYEPCDFLKVQELYMSSIHNKYTKAPGEDLNSIIAGIQQPKGNIHMAMGKPISSELDAIAEISNDNEKIKVLASVIDKQIYADYKLYSVNYIAADMILKSNTYKEFYTETDKQNFINYMATSLKALPKNDLVEGFFLNIYGNPVFNKHGIKI